MNDQKPGWQTSEAWTTIGASGSVVALAAQDPSEWVRVAAVLVTGLVAVAYVLSRGRAKGGAK